MGAITFTYRRRLFVLLGAGLLGGLVLALVTLELVDSPADAASGDTERVSVDSAGGEAGDASFEPAVSGDGRFVAFNSAATNLVLGDTNGTDDVFVRDRETGETTRVSVDSLGAEVDGSSRDLAISGDGRFVAFRSTATSLIAGDTNGATDVFVHDRETGETTRVSVDSLGGESDGPSFAPAVNGDGRFVAFTSSATTLVAGDTNGVIDIFVHDRQTGETTRVSVDSGGGEGDDDSFNPTVSADGRFVSFNSAATNLVLGDTNGTSDVFVHDRDTGETTRVSVDSAGGEGDNDSSRPTVSADGRFVAFGSEATNLVPSDTNGVIDIFVHDRQTGETTRVSVESGGGEGDDVSADPAISGDGRFVAFNSFAALVAGDTNDADDIFIHDRQTGQTTRVSVDSVGGEADDESAEAAISADGRFVAFQSDAGNLVAGDTNDAVDVFVHDRGVQATLLIQGDNDCDGDTDSVDALKGLQHVAAVDFSQEEGCPALGSDVASLFGDVDCDDDVDSVDQLKILRQVAALSVSQNEPCPDIGDPL